MERQVLGSDMLQKTVRVFVFGPFDLLRTQIHIDWRTVVISLLLVCSHNVAWAWGETPYWRLTTDRITVVSDASAKRCTRLAMQFITFERVLRDLADLDGDSNFPPLAVYSLSEFDAKRVFLTEADRREQQVTNMRIFSKFLPASDVNVAAIVDVNGGGDEALQSILLLYGQSMLAGGATRTYPVWYQIGVANITNGLLIRDDGSVLLNRNVPFEPIVDKDKRAKTKYDLATLLGTSARDLAVGGDIKEFSRRAREWAQFGLITSAERRRQYRELATLMRQGTPADDAVTTAFGVSLAQLSQEFEDGKWRKQAEFKIPAPATAPLLPVPTRLEANQASALLQLVSDRVAQEAARR